MRTSKFSLLLPALCFWLLAVGCQKQAPLAVGEAAAMDSLRSAMYAIDSGDLNRAEELLKQSISQDPQNSSRAKIMLSSIYAQRAGVELKDWLDPLYYAGIDIDAKARLYRRADELIDMVTDQLKNREQPANAEEAEMKKRVASLVKAAGRAALGLMVTTDIFYQTPVLDADQQAKLDQAILVLYPDVQAHTLSEEGRVYLSILSIVRLVNNVKRIAGDRELMDYLKDKKALCGTNPKTFELNVKEIKQSLDYLKAGLEIFPYEEMNKRRAARKKIGDFIQKLLTGDHWQKIDRFFQAGTLEQRVGLRTATDICFFVNTASEPEPGEEGVPETDLFNPDDFSPPPGNASS